MSFLNTAISAVGTYATLKSLFGGGGGGEGGKMANFLSEIRQSGVARTNMFDVVITPPKIALSNSGVAQKISLFAEGAALPGRSIQQQEFSRFGYGPHEKFPYAVQFQDYTLQFIGDGRGEIYKFFYNWMNGIVRSDYRIETYGSQVDKGGKSAFEVEYRENYAVDIKLNVYNEQNETIFTVTLTNAFPIQVPDVSLNWGESSMMQFSVTFAFTQAILNNAEQPLKTSQGASSELSTLQKLVKIGTAVQALSSLKRPGNVQDALSSATTIKNVTSAF